MKIIFFKNSNTELQSHENLIIPLQHHENHEIHKTIYENHEKQIII